MWASTLARFDINTFLASDGVERKAETFKKDAVIFTQGGRNDSIFFIEKGAVKLTVTSGAGVETIIAIMDGGHFVGESCIIGNVPYRLHSAVCITEVRVRRVKADAWMRLMQHPGRDSTVLVTYLAQVIAQLEEELVSSLVDSSAKRLARALLSLSRFRRAHAVKLAGVVNQQVLAGMIGVSRQQVNALMRDFRKSGFVDDVQGTKINESLRTFAPPDRLRGKNGTAKKLSPRRAVL